MTAPLFVATKIEAFRSRERGDLVASHDLEDIIVLDVALIRRGQVASALTHPLRQRHLIEHSDRGCSKLSDKRSRTSVLDGSDMWSTPRLGVNWKRWHGIASHTSSMA